MKRFIFTLVPVLLSLSIMAQKDFYMFIQQSSGQPFYVRMGEKSISSTVGGHLILAGLRDTGYNLIVGFPKEAEPEQLFMVPMQGRDRGYELKNMNGIWELFDMQTYKFIKATVIQKKVVQQGVRKTDGYSQLMADVVDDSSVQYMNVVYREEPKPEQKTVAPVVVAKSIKETKKMGPELPAPADIIRYGSENMEEGKEIIYLDRTAPVTDTIRIMIPRL